MKYAKAIAVAIALLIGFALTFIFGAISFLLAAITLMMGGFTVHTYLFFYKSKPKDQREKQFLIPVAMYLAYTIFFGAFTLYMVSRWVATL